jgi:diamine N-acetyltransferase
VIAPIQPHQLSALEILARKAFSETFAHLYTPEDLEHHLRTTCSAEFFAASLEKGDTILIAEESGALVGYAKFGGMGLPVQHGPHDREIHRLYVLRSHQGTGLGHRLMQAMLEALCEAPILYLGVWSGNHKALKFYARYGFEHCGNYTYYVGTHADDEYILRRMRHPYPKKGTAP